jgi:hypothetical protein
MAAALLSHMTFISDLRALPEQVVAQAAPWTDFYKRHRDAFIRGVVYPLLDDPIAGGWTALQSWDPEAGTGALLAFRQASDEPTRKIALRNVPPGRRFRLVSAPDGALVATASSRRLRRGIEIELPEKDSARVLLISALDR